MDTLQGGGADGRGVRGGKDRASNGSPYNRQLRGRDSRMYRPYIRYSWEGREYVARSVAAYGRAKIFPGDRVRVLVNDEDRELVKII